MKVTALKTYIVKNRVLDYNSDSIQPGELIYDTLSNTLSFSGNGVAMFEIKSDEIRKIRFRYFRLYIYSTNKNFIVQFGKRPELRSWQGTSPYKSAMKIAQIESGIEQFAKYLEMYYCKDTKEMFEWWNNNGVAFKQEGGMIFVKDEVKNQGSIELPHLNAQEHKESFDKDIIITPVNQITESYLIYFAKRHGWVLAVFIGVFIAYISVYL